MSTGNEVWPDFFFTLEGDSTSCVVTSSESGIMNPNLPRWRTTFQVQLGVVVLS